MLELLLSVAVAPQPIEDTAIQTIQEQSIKVETEVEEPTTHEIKENETLEKIAKQHKVGWQRIFDKNTELENPHAIEVGDILVIPDNDETLPERVYAVYLPPTPVVTESSVAAVRSSPVAVSKGSPPLSWWGRGQCTFHVASKRSVGHWNNASAWLSQARRDGWATGSTPQVGAIAWESNHVAYVESISGDMVTVSEMNYRGVGVVSTRTVPASQFQYIY